MRPTVTVCEALGVESRSTYPGAWLQGVPRPSADRNVEVLNGDFAAKGVPQGTVEAMYELV